MASPTIEILIDLEPYRADRTKFILGKTLDELNLIMTTKIKRKIETFIHSLIDLKIVIGKKEKINIDRGSLKKKIKNIALKALKELKTKKPEEFERKFKFLTLKNWYFKEISDYEQKEKKVREIARKNMKELDNLKYKSKRY